MDQNLLKPLGQIIQLNSVSEYWLAALGAGLIVISGWLLQQSLIAYLKSKRKIHLQIIESWLLPAAYWWFGCRFFSQLLTWPAEIKRATDLLFLAWASAIIISLIDKIISSLVARHLSKDQQAQALLKMLSNGVKVSLWIIGGLLLLANSGLNISSLLAGLGISGIAVALAAQNVLGDLFGSIAIYLDKPFKTGDYIRVGNDSGLVLEIGLKSTKLKGDSGQLIIISNKELASSRIHNFKKQPPLG